MKTATALYLSELTAALHYTYGTFKNTAHTAQTIHEAHRLAKALHARYVATCNHAWANTPAYEKRTDKLEVKLCKLLEMAGFVACPGHTIGNTGTPPLAYALQRDPRGWPLTLSIYGRVDSVGREV